MGNLALSKNQIGVETTAGTSVVATRQLVGQLRLEDARTRDHRTDEQRASFQSHREVTDLAYLSTGKYTARVTSMELPYWLSAAIRGDVTPTTLGTTVKSWDFLSPVGTIPALKTLTGYFGDNSQALKATGVAVKKLSIKGGDEKPLMLSCDVIGRRLQTGTFASLTHPTTESMKSLLTKWYIDTTGAGLAGTQITGTVYDWEWTLDTGIEPDYAEDGSLDMGDYHRGTPKVSLKVTAKWNSTMVSEFSSFDSGTTRFIAIKNEGSTIETTYKHTLAINGAYVVDKFNVLSGDKNGTNLVELEATAIEDSTWGLAFAVGVQNTLTAL